MSSYRAPVRSRRDDVDPGLALERALVVGVVGGDRDTHRARADHWLVTGAV